MITKKLLLVRVVEGVDTGLETWLTGESVGVGVGPEDAIRLSDVRALPGHVRFLRDGRRGWRFQGNGSAQLRVGGRSVPQGTARAGLRIDLDGPGVLEIVSARPPAALAAKESAEEKGTLSEGAQWAVVAVCLGAMLVALSALRTNPTPPPAPPDLADRRAALAESYTACTDGLVAPADDGRLVDDGQPDLYWRARHLVTLGAEDAARATSALLYQRLDDAVVRAMLLEQRGDAEGALAQNRRIQALLPVGPCPITDQARAAAARLSPAVDGR